MPQQLKRLKIREVSLVDRPANKSARVVLCKAENPTKTEDGKHFQASDYAYAPDHSSPSTWKLRLTSTPGGSPDPHTVGAAVAALGEGFRGNKVSLPSKDRAAVIARVKAAWRKAHPEAGQDDLPSVLKCDEGAALEGSALQRVLLALGLPETVVSKFMKEDDSMPMSEEVVKQLTDRVEKLETEKSLSALSARIAKSTRSLKSEADIQVAKRELRQVKDELSKLAPTVKGDLHESLEAIEDALTEAAQAVNMAEEAAGEGGGEEGTGKEAAATHKEACDQFKSQHLHPALHSAFDGMSEDQQKEAMAKMKPAPQHTPDPSVKTSMHKRMDPVVKGLQDKVDKLETERAVAEIAKGELGGMETFIKVDEMAGHIHQLRKSADNEEAVGYLLSTVKRFAKMAQEAGLFKTLGRDGEGSAETRLDSLAKAYAKDKGVSIEKAMSAVLQDNPALYEQSLAEGRG